MQPLNRQKHIFKSLNCIWLLSDLFDIRNNKTRSVNCAAIALSVLGVLIEYIKCSLAFSCPITPNKCLKDRLIIETII